MMQASKEMLVFFWHKLWKIKITPFMRELHVETRTRTNHNSSFSRQRSSLPFRAFLPFPLPFWSLSRSLNIPFISLALWKARERWRVLRARKGRACPLIARATLSRVLYFLSACHKGYQPRQTRQSWLPNDQQVDARSLLNKVLKNIFTSERCLLHALFNYAIPRECLTDNRDFLYLQSLVELQLLWSLCQKGN